MKKIITADGSLTLFNEEYQEAYHSTKAGAYTESLHKFVKPTKIVELAKEKNSISILDIGFGLGYNVATAINEVIRNSPYSKLIIYSLEKDTSILDKLKNIEPSEELKNIYSKLLNGNFESKKIGKQNFKVYTVKNKNLEIYIIFEDARQTIKKLYKTNLKFDAVFWDAFSPKVNTELWTVNLFKLVKKLMKPYAILATYSASLAVRKGLIEAGFKIGLVEPIGRKSYSTVASLEGEIRPLTEKEKERLENSPYAIAYYDNEELTLYPKKIKEEWEKRLKQNLNKV